MAELDSDPVKEIGGNANQNPYLSSDGEFGKFSRGARDRSRGRDEIFSLRTSNRCFFFFIISSIEADRNSADLKTHPLSSRKRNVNLWRFFQVSRSPWSGGWSTAE